MNARHADSKELDSQIHYVNLALLHEADPIRSTIPLRWEAFTKRYEQLRWPFDADSSSNKRPHKAPLFGNNAEPCAAVSANPDVRCSDVPVSNINGFVSNRYRRLRFLLACKGKMVRGIQPF